MRYEDIAEQFEKDNEKNGMFVKNELERYIKSNDYETIKKATKACFQADIKSGHIPYTPNQSPDYSQLLDTMRAIADIAAKKFDMGELISNCSTIMGTTYEALEHYLDPITSEDRLLLQDFLSRSYTILPNYIIRRAIQNKKARAYCITKQLVQALEQTRLKGLTAKDIKLPEPLTVVHLIGKSPSIVVFHKIEHFLSITVFSLDESTKGCDPVYTYASCTDEILLDTYDHNIKSALKNDTYHANTHSELHRISINALLYITNNPKDVWQTDANKEVTDLKARMLNTEGAKREKLKERLRRMPKTPIQLVGRHYVIDKKLQRDPTVSGEADYHLRVRFIVAGHWRKQACGPGLTERRLMWIQPYWKGPEFAPITRSIGIVK
jgi:hypothetical protein